MATAGDQIKSALRLIGMLAEGETPSPSTSNDALEAFNQMLDSWSIERLAVFTTQDQTFTWPANTATRTIGPSGDFVGLRPIQIDAATYFIDPSSGVSYQIKQLNEAQFNNIALKTATSSFPRVMTVTPDMPDMSMTVFPIPDRSLTWHIVSVSELSQPAVLATTLVFPPGYIRAFKYNLACEIAAEFGVEPPTTVQRIAMASKRNLKRINNPLDVMSLPAGLTPQTPRFNIYSGNM
jgi:hypothetical protein